MDEDFPSSFFALRFHSIDILDQMRMTRKRSAIILDAGYVAIRTNSTVIALGLHGKKLICVVTVVFMLIFVSVINLTVSDASDQRCAL